MLPPLLPRGLRIVSTSSLETARSSSEEPPWFQLAHHVGTNQDNADRLCCSVYHVHVTFCLSGNPPHACRPVALSPSPSVIALPRPFAHSLARQDAQRAALPATKAGRRTVVSASVPVYDDHISQLHGPRSDNTGETRATSTLCDCLLADARSHALGGGEAAPVIGTKRISCRPPGPLDGLAASMLALCRCQ